MPPSRVTVTDEERLEAIVLLQRYSLELDEVAASVLGGDPTSALDLQVLRTIARVDGGASPSRLVEQLGMPRSTLARSISRLRRRGLVERRTDTRDGRRARITASATGQDRVLRYEQALVDFLSDGAAVVKEVMLLLVVTPSRRTAPGSPPGCARSPTGSTSPGRGTCTTS
ncbi:MAG TPA: helix-turn-helix domain-containing protein [Ornithinibacter sp.]|nr:helix-turn-helix domain-containing protein [Ornithinibacter sp.]